MVGAVEVNFVRDRLAALRSGPGLARPGVLLDSRQEHVDRLLSDARRSLGQRVQAGDAEVARLLAQVTALSPAATLERGYAVVQRPDGPVVRDPAQVRAGERLRVRVAQGELTALAEA